MLSGGRAVSFPFLPAPYSQKCLSCLPSFTHPATFRPHTLTVHHQHSLSILYHHSLQPILPHYAGSLAGLRLESAHNICSPTGSRAVFEHILRTICNDVLTAASRATTQGLSRICSRGMCTAHFFCIPLPLPCTTALRLYKMLSGLLRLAPAVRSTATDHQGSTWSRWSITSTTDVRHTWSAIPALHKISHNVVDLRIGNATTMMRHEI